VQNHSGACFDCKVNGEELTEHEILGNINHHCSSCVVPGECPCDLCLHRAKRLKLTQQVDKSEETTQSDSVEETTDDTQPAKRRKPNHTSNSKVCARIYTTIKVGFLTEKVNGNKPMEGTASFGKYLKAHVGDEIHYIAGRAVCASFRIVMIDGMCCCECALRKYGWEQFGRAAGSFNAALVVYFELFGTPAAEESRESCVLCDALRWSKKTHDASIRDNCVGFLVWKDCLIKSNFFVVQIQQTTPEGLSSIEELMLPPGSRNWKFENSDSTGVPEVGQGLDGSFIPGTLWRSNVEQPIFFKPGKVAF
jgi:hypothetical protein